MIKIVRQSFNIYSVLLFTILSYILMYIVNSIALGESALSVFSLKTFAENHLYLLGFLTITSIFIWKIQRQSHLFYLAFHSILLFQFVMSFINSQNKIILIIIFLFMIHVYLFFLTLNAEINSASNNPLYLSNQANLNFIKKMNVTIYSVDGVYEGFLTNWNDHSCFIHLPSLEGEFPSGKVKLITKHFGKEFTGEGSISSKYTEGIGIRFIETPEEVYNWKLLTGILNKKGILPI